MVVLEELETEDDEDCTGAASMIVLVSAVIRGRVRKGVKKQDDAFGSRGITAEKFCK